MLYDQNTAEDGDVFLKFWTDSVKWGYCGNKVIDTDVLRQMIAKEKKMLDELEKVISQVERKKPSKTLS